MLNLTELRANLYQTIDALIETGIPVEIERKGHIIKIVLESPPSKLSRLVSRKIVRGNEEDLVHFDWSSYWNQNKDV